MLICLHIQMKNYLECVTRGYLGEDIAPQEKALIDKFANIPDDIDKALKYYFETERDLMEP